jgi:addiction module RelB/DinJ family antitoxin
MSKEAVLQIRIDAALKEAAEALYRDMGTSLPEAVRMFARQSVAIGGMPFAPRTVSSGGAFAAYANPELRKLEVGAFSRAMGKKHASPA